MSTQGWEVRHSKSRNRPYFYNADTQASVWDKPEGLTDDQIATLPGVELLAAPAASSASAEAPAPASEGKVRASHLLVKHAGSRRPSSWKEARIERSKEEAVAILQGYEAELKPLTGSDLQDKFASLASANSDCGSHSHGGDLGLFGRGQMQKAFEEASYALAVGEMSGIIETDSGVHLILRTA